MAHMQLDDMYLGCRQHALQTSMDSKGAASHLASDTGCCTLTCTLMVQLHLTGLSTLYVVAVVPTCVYIRLCYIYTDNLNFQKKQHACSHMAQRAEQLLMTVTSGFAHKPGYIYMQAQVCTKPFYYLAQATL